MISVFKKGQTSFVSKVVSLKIMLKLLYADFFFVYSVMITSLSAVNLFSVIIGKKA